MSVAYSGTLLGGAFFSAIWTIIQPQFPLFRIFCIDDIFITSLFDIHSIHTFMHLFIRKWNRFREIGRPSLLCGIGWSNAARKMRIKNNTARKRCCFCWRNKIKKRGRKEDFLRKTLLRLQASFMSIQYPPLLNVA